MSKLRFALFFLLISGSFLFFGAGHALAATYYVSQSTGNDSCNGSSSNAYNSSTNPTNCPFQNHPDSNLATGSSVALRSNFQPGDVIEMKAGDTWYGTQLTTQKAGSSGAPILTTSYGTGAAPLIAAAQLLNGTWTSQGSNVYSISDPVDPYQPYMVYNGSTLLTLGTNVTPSLGQWYWASSVLYVNIGSDPSGGNIQATARASAITINHAWRSYSNLNLEYSNDNGGYFGVITINAQHATFNNVSASRDCGDGFILEGSSSSYTTLVGGTFTGNGTESSAFLLTGTGDNYSGFTLQNIATGNASTASNAVNLLNLTNSNISNFTINNCYDNGIYISGASYGNNIFDGTISNCWNHSYYGNNGFGQGINAANNSGSNNIYGNFFSKNYQNIYDTASGNNAYYDNIAYAALLDNVGAWGSGIPTFYNNTILHQPSWLAGNGGAAYVGHAINSRGSGGAIYKNNIVALLPLTESGGPWTTQYTEITHGSGVTPTVTLNNNLYINLSSGTATGQWAISGPGNSNYPPYPTGSDTNSNYYPSFSAFQAAMAAITYFTINGQDAQSLNGQNPSFINGSGNLNQSTDFEIGALSPAIDAGTPITSLTTDILGNPIYGPGDIGAYAYQPPYTFSANKMPADGTTARLYSNGQYRTLTATSSSAIATFSVTPQGGFYTASTSEYMDIAINNWTTLDKNWMASSTASGLGYTHATSTVYTIGDLAPNALYTFHLDSATSTALTSSQCTGSLCTADNTGTIVFTYTGGYSSHTFDLGEDPPPTISSVSTIATPSNNNKPSFSFSSSEAGTLLTSGSCTPSSTSVSSGANTIAFNVLFDGTYSNCAFSVLDAFGNDSATTTLNSFFIDTVPPVFSSLTPANASSMVNTGSFSWSAADALSGIASYTLTLDGTPISGLTTSSYIPATPLACNSTHTWSVEAIDNVGNYTNSTPYTMTAVCPGGAGGGSSSATVSTPVTTPTVSTPSTITPASTSSHPSPSATAGTAGLSSVETQAILSLLSSFGADTDIIAHVQAALGETASTTSSSTTTYQFTRNLSLYDTGTDVKELQEFLNDNGFTVAETGPGSQGNETTKFGIQTYRALVTYQKSVGLPATGYFGVRTRGKIAGG
jgi:hypothetical protein